MLVVVERNKVALIVEFIESVAYVFDVVDEKDAV
jgi:hypothetical protein